MATPKKTKGGPAKPQEEPAKPVPGKPTPGPPPLKMAGFKKRRTEAEKVTIDKLATGSATFLMLAVIYRMFFIDVTQVFMGIGRKVQPIEDFPYDCQRVVHPLLEACEDFWLDESGRKLYAACSSVETRQGWNPGAGLFNQSARTGTDHISVLDIDRPGSDGLFGVRQVEVGHGFQGSLDLLNIQAHEVDGRLRFWLVNHRPPVNTTTGELLADASTYGANSTIEIFDLSKVSNKLEHVKTIASDALITPNSVAVSKDGLDFFVTNSHSRRAGWRRELEALTGGGSVAHCRSDTGECRIIATEGFNFANGIVRGNDDLYYVATTLGGRIYVYRYKDDKFVGVNEAYPKVPLDNLSVDAEGNIIVATLPHGFTSLKSIHNPYGPLGPASILKMERLAPTKQDPKPRYNVTKLIEDGESKFLPTATVAVHDVKTGRLFISGVASQFITVCEKRV